MAERRPDAPRPARPRFPGFRLEETIRRTRVGVWFRAFQERIGRDVLLKIPPRGDERAFQLLQREVEILGRHRHVGLITLFDFRGDREYPYAVYEFPGERTLEDLVSGTGSPPSVESVIELSIQIADLLHGLHSGGLFVHQASPSEFFVDDTGRLRLASTEGFEPGGLPDSELSPLWVAPGAGGVSGDLFLLGLHIVHLLGGKVPVPASLAESPAAGLDRLTGARFGRGSDGMGAAVSRSEAEVGAKLVTLVEQLLAAPASAGRLDAAAVLRDLRAIQAGHSIASRPRRRALAMALLLLPALCLAGVLGPALWRLWLGDAGGPDPGSLEVATAPHGQASPGTDPRPGTTPPAGDEAGVDAGVPVVTVAGGESVRGPGSASSGESGAENGREEISGPERESGGGPSPSTTPEVAGVDLPVENRVDRGGQGDDGSDSTGEEAAPEPVSVPATPSATETFVHRVTRFLGFDREARPEAAAPLWEDGLRILELERDRLIAQLAEGATTSASTEAFLAALLEIRQELEIASVRRGLFAAPAQFHEGDRFEVTYDFSSRTQLRDWQPVGDRSRLSIHRGRLVVLGEARLRPALRLRDPVEIEWRVPPAARSPDRPNINLVIWLDDAARKSLHGETRALLFGVGTYLDHGILEGAGADGKPLLLPADLVLETDSARRSNGGVGVDRERNWNPVRVLPPVRRPDHWREAETFVFLWNGERISWSAGGRQLLGPDARSEAAAGLPTLAGRRFVIGFETMSSTVEIAGVSVRGCLDPGSLQALARARALDRLRERAGDPRLVAALPDR